MHIMVTNFGTSIEHNMDTHSRLWVYSREQGARELDVVLQRGDALVLMSHEQQQYLQTPFFFHGRAIIVCTPVTPGITAEDVSVEIIEDLAELEEAEERIDVAVAAEDLRTTCQRVSDTAHEVMNYFLAPLFDWTLRRVVTTLPLP